MPRFPTGGKFAWNNPSQAPQGAKTNKSIASLAHVWQNQDLKMNNKSTESKAAAMSAGAVVFYVIYSGVINFARLASDPWYRSPLFSIGGSLLAAIALFAGAFAYFRGRSFLDPRHRQFAVIGIIAGLSYLSCIAIALFAL